LLVSRALADEVAANPRLEVLGPAHELQFDAKGQLRELLMERVTSRA